MRILIVCLSIVAFGASAQPGYKIEFKIQGLKDTTAFLGYYYGESTYIKDTARVDKQGYCAFDNAVKLPPGVYFFVLNKTRMFDIVVSDDQHFLMETSTAEYIQNMKVKGDEDNRLFFENMIYNMERHKEADPFVKIIQDSSRKEDQKKDARAAYARIGDQVAAHQKEVIQKYPATMTAKLLKLSRQIDVPPAPKKPDGTIDSTFQFRYYRDHFFDNFDLGDEGLTRLPRPAYQEKVYEYLDKLNFQVPDSLVKAIGKMAVTAKKNRETYKYLIYICVSKYQRPEIMGLDEVYVQLYDKYFATGEMDFWADATLKKNFREHADKLRMSLIGKTGPNLSMQDQNFQQRNLYDIKKKYALIYFFDPDCGHCREESPKLVEFYNKNKARFDLEVFAVSADTSIIKMKEYIKEMKMTWITVNGPRTYVGPYNKLYYAESTPTLYILDDKHKIIAKGISADRLEDFFVNYQAMQQKKAAQKIKGS